MTDIKFPFEWKSLVVDFLYFLLNKTTSKLMEGAKITGKSQIIWQLLCIVFSANYEF